MTTILLILGSVVAVSLVSLVGVLAISTRQERLVRALAFLIPLAVGALLGDAFFHLIPEAFEETKNAIITSLLLFVGVMVFFFLEKYLRWHHHSEVTTTTTTAEDKDSKHLGYLLLISDGLHNFIDGVIIAVSFLVSTEVGLATTLAVILHEIPQEIGDFGVLIYSGYTRKSALFYNFLSALCAVAGAMVVIILGSLPEEVVRGVIPFAAGTFIYIASSDLVPELHKNRDGKNLLPEITGIATGALAMYLLLFLE